MYITFLCRLESKFILILTLARLSDAGKAQADKDVCAALVGVTNKLHQKGCVIVLIFDDLPTLLSNQLIKKLARDDRVFMTLDLSLENSTAEFDASERVAQYLRSLYRMYRCYTFVIWVKNPRLLYPSNVNVHPGYRHQDLVFLPSHHISEDFGELVQLRFWSAIPNIIGLRRLKPRRVQLYTVLPYSERGEQKYKELDVWLVSKAKFERRNVLVWDKFTSFNQNPFSIVQVLKAPFYIWGDIKNPYLDGLDWRLLLAAQKNMKFTFNLTKYRYTNKSGNKYDGNWTGVMGYLQSGKSEMGVGGLSANPERLADFDFCKTYYTDSYGFISPISLAEPVVLRIFAKPLAGQVWQALLVTTILVIVSLKYLSRAERKLLDFNKNGKKYPDECYTSFSRNFHYVYTTFCQKPYPHVPKSNPLKIIFITTTLSITIIGYVFAGSLFSQMLNSKLENSLDTFEEIRKSNLPVCVLDYDGTLSQSIKETDSEAIQDIWRNATFVDYYESIACIEEVVFGKGVYIDSVARLNFLGRYNYAGKHGPKFHFGSELLRRQVQTGWATRKQWPFKRRIDRILSHILEMGIADYWMSKFKQGLFGWDRESLNILTSGIPLTLRSNNTDDVDPSELLHDQKFTRLGLNEFQTVNLMWIQGMIIAILVFIGEVAAKGLSVSTRFLYRHLCSCLKYTKMKWKRVKRKPLAKQK